jgi:L,D-peptidoglycan transpeptidase YkuD (ErfK/YbiS/YcfS/YnhG family)
MGWCDDIKSKKYNKLININEKYKCEKLYRKDNKYDYLIVLDYNLKKPIRGKGSAIFLHLTKNYKPTAGCIAISQNDFEILLKLIKKNSFIKI